MTQTTMLSTGIEFELDDMFVWLERHRGEGAVVTMLPDADELGFQMPEYRAFLRAAATACFDASTGPTVFAQTDRMASGTWLDKAALIMAERPAEMLWHKIILRRDVGRVDLRRPTYTHLLAFGPGRPGARTPDVIHGGRQLWPNGVGVDAAAFVAAWLRDVGVNTVLNPCAGHGTFASACTDVGLVVRACDVVRRGVFA